MIRAKTERHDGKNFVCGWSAIPKSKCPEVSEAADVHYFPDDIVPEDFFTGFYNYYVESGQLLKSYVAEAANKA